MTAAPVGRRTSSQSVDGRTARRTRNVDAVLDAIIELAGEGSFDPTAEEIADRAGVSHRSIYRYFDSRAELLGAAVRRAVEQIAPVLYFDHVGEGSLDVRVERFVSARLEVHSAFGPVVRTVLNQGDEAPRASLDQVSLSMREQLEAHFAAELDRLDDADRTITVGVLDSLFHFDALHHLDSSMGHDHDLLATALRRHLMLHLGRDAG